MEKSGFGGSLLTYVIVEYNICEEQKTGVFMRKAVPD